MSQAREKLSHLGSRLWLSFHECTVEIEPNGGHLHGGWRLFEHSREREWRKSSIIARRGLGPKYRVDSDDSYGKCIGFHACFLSIEYVLELFSILCCATVLYKKWIPTRIQSLKAVGCYSRMINLYYFELRGKFPVKMRDSPSCIPVSSWKGMCEVYSERRSKSQSVVSNMERRFSASLLIKQRCYAPQRGIGIGSDGVVSSCRKRDEKVKSVHFYYSLVRSVETSESNPAYEV